MCMCMCVVVCSLCSFFEAGKKPACFASAFHQASTAWEASIRVIVPGDPSSMGLVHRELDRHRPSLSRAGHQGECFHCRSSSGRALDRLLRDPLLVDAIGPVWHFLCNPSRGAERKISILRCWCVSTGLACLRTAPSCRARYCGSEDRSRLE